MKRLSILLVLLTVSVFAYSLEIQVGPTALYNYYLDPDAPATDVTFDDFTFGGEARVKLGLLEGAALGLISPSAEDPDIPGLTYPAEMELYLTAGVALDFVLLRAGIGIGPNFLFVFDENSSDPADFGANVKLHADVMLGDISLSLNYLIIVPDLTEEGLDIAQDSEGLVGLSLLFKL